MIRINLLPPEERSSIKAIQAKAILLVVGIILCSLMVFSGVYLRLAIKWEQDEITGYRETMASMDEFRVATARLEKDIKTLTTQLAPLSTAAAAVTPAFNIQQMLERVAQSAETGNIWLQDITLQKSGLVPINGFAVDFSELNRFISTMSMAPYHMQMGSQTWDVRGGVRVVVFSAQIASSATAGEEKQ